MVFADGDCLPPLPRDLISGIQISRRHDVVGFCDQLVTLGPEQTRRILVGTSLEAAHLEAAGRRGEGLPLAATSCLLRRGHLEDFGGWSGAVEALGGADVFRCPVPGVRLGGS